MKKIVYIFIALLLWGCSSSQKKQNEEGAIDSTKVVSQAIFPDWSQNAVIYEVNVRQFTPEGTFEAFSKHMPRLKEMGIDILWFMPIYPISEKNRKGTLGSYYAISDYKAINPEFGSLEDFKAVVDQAHNLGMKVILDWVANHTGWDGPWIENHPEWFTQDSLGNIVSPVEDWSDVADLNYDVPEMRTTMIDALKYWVAEANIDGYRCDMAGMVPVDFWEAARLELDKIKPVFMLAEDEAEPALLHKAFNANYGWELHHIMNKIAKSEAGVADVKTYFDKADSLYPAGSFTMHFTSNHDENSWQGTEYERMGDAVKTMAALSFVIPGMPLIYSGQEAGLKKRLEFFEKDEIDWTNLEMQDFYAKLIQLKKENISLWNGISGGNLTILEQPDSPNLLVLIREKDGNKVLAFFNLSDQPIATSVSDDALKGRYKDAFTGQSQKLKQKTTVELGAWEYKIWVSSL